MAGERRAIEHPLFVDFRHLPVPPLEFVLQTAYSPTGVLERPEPGVLWSHTPWYSQVALELVGLDAQAVLCVMQTDEEHALVMACLDETVEPFFKMVSGADFGDPLTRLTALHWPEVYAMLLRSNDGTPNARILCNVATPGRIQWVVADPIPVGQQPFIGDKQALDLIASAVQTFLKVTSFPVEPPGAFEVLGGPDRVSRRLKAAAGLLNATADIGGTLQGGLHADELIDLAKGAREAVESMLALKD